MIPILRPIRGWLDGKKLRIKVEWLVHGHASYTKDYWNFWTGKPGKRIQHHFLKWWSLLWNNHFGKFQLSIFSMSRCNATIKTKVLLLTCIMFPNLPHRREHTYGSNLPPFFSSEFSGDLSTPHMFHTTQGEGTPFVKNRETWAAWSVIVIPLRHLATVVQKPSHFEPKKWSFRH